MSQKILVDLNALRELLGAVVGEGHLIRELQATRDLPQELCERANPINVLLEQYHEAAARQFVPPVVWPEHKRVARCGDMAPYGHTHLTVELDADNDVHVALWEQTQDSADDPAGQRAVLEFCTSQGGGKSPRTREALIALMVAMEQDHQTNPSHQWPPERAKKPS